MKKKTISVYSEYCTGCGLCESVNGTLFYTDENGNSYPELSENDDVLCSIVCPAAGYALNQFSDGSIWGQVKAAYLGWSTNPHIRQMASSGGIISSLCIYLLEHHIVDGIIQISKDPKDPRKTINTISRTEEDVLKCMGSRYTSSRPLSDIKQNIQKEERYAFVGKPCDVSALRMYKEVIDAPWTRQIVFMFSFFCAGQPSLSANDKLLKALGCTDHEDCVELQYRGNGWPGYAVATLKNGIQNRLDYETAWMRILGRDVRRSCRFCADGTGEYADIACGDAWYLTKDGRPDFSEHPGRNVIICRTADGVTLLKETINSGNIVVEDYDIEKDELRKSQPYHLTRKASLNSLRWAMLLCGRRFPLYDGKKLRRFSKYLSFGEQSLRFLGTIERIIKKKI